MNNSLIHIFKKSTCTKIASWYLEMYKDLLKKYDLEIYIVYKEDEKIILNEEKKMSLEKKGLKFLSYKNENDFKKFLDLKKENNNIKIYTYYEELIDFSNNIKKYLGQEVTEIEKLFISKKLQRENLLKFDKNITVNFLKFNNLENLNINEILENFEFPFIIKPSFGISSSGVVKINSKEELDLSIKDLKNVFENINKDRLIKDYEIIIEEYIDGKMYTIDYFVDEKGKINKSTLIKTNTLKDEYDIDDFGITNEILGEKISKEIDEKILVDFLEKNVKACKIKNTFIHHEFKLISKGKLKTIELNGRIGGYRPEMYKQAYNLNLLEFMFNDNIKPNFQKNYQFIGLFPREETGKIFLGLKEEFIEKVKKLNSYSNFMIKESFIGKKIGFTKNGYKYFGSIRLINKNYETLAKDYSFIKENLDKNIVYKK